MMSQCVQFKLFLTQFFQLLLFCIVHRPLRYVGFPSDRNRCWVLHPVTPITKARPPSQWSGMGLGVEYGILPRPVLQVVQRNWSYAWQESSLLALGSIHFSDLALYQTEDEVKIPPILSRPQCTSCKPNYRASVVKISQIPLHLSQAILQISYPEFQRLILDALL